MIRDRVVGDELLLLTVNSNETELPTEETHSHSIGIGERKTRGVITNYLRDNVKSGLTPVSSD